MYSCFCFLEIHASILNQVRVVDLSLSSEEIQELMLTKLLQSDCKELLIQHLRLQNEKHLMQEKLFKQQVTTIIYHHIKQILLCLNALCSLPIVMTDISLVHSCLVGCFQLIIFQI